MTTPAAFLVAVTGREVWRGGGVVGFFLMSKLNLSSL